MSPNKSKKTLDKGKIAVKKATLSEKTPTISVQGIKKAFGNNRVLKGINMDVMPGEVVALVGGNGAGKSTLMKIIMGIYQSDEGTIYMGGEEAKMNRPSAALAYGVYLVPQEPMLFPNMTVEENISMGFAEKKSLLRSQLVTLVCDLG
ncbi:MAG: sugar ABC transporter ATP-binding protein, partial [Clostridiales bacterium]|nr:sugar ABC transporter ATP-binding protein [Clostridiales bacterium]